VAIENRFMALADGTRANGIHSRMPIPKWPRKS